MKNLKILIEQHGDGYVAYPLGIKGVVVGQGDTYEEALADVESAVLFHVETFGQEALHSADQLLCNWIFRKPPKGAAACSPGSERCRRDDPEASDPRNPSPGATAVARARAREPPACRGACAPGPAAAPWGLRLFCTP